MGGLLLRWRGGIIFSRAPLSFYFLCSSLGCIWWWVMWVARITRRPCARAHKTHGQADRQTANTMDTHTHTSTGSRRKLLNRIFGFFFPAVADPLRRFGFLRLMIVTMNQLIIDFCFISTWCRHFLIYCRTLKRDARIGTKMAASITDKNNNIQIKVWSKFEFHNLPPLIWIKLSNVFRELFVFLLLFFFFFFFFWSAWVSERTTLSVFGMYCSYSRLSLNGGAVLSDGQSLLERVECRRGATIALSSHGVSSLGSSHFPPPPFSRFIKKKYKNTIQMLNVILATTERTELRVCNIRDWVRRPSVHSKSAGWIVWLLFSKCLI
jgi:hypothetical protein